MRIIKHLNFDWYFSIYKDSYIEDYKTIDNFKKVDIPHNMVNLNYNYNNPKSLQVIGIYRKTIKIEKSYQGKILKLNFDGVAHHSRIFINGEYITSHFGGYDSFTVDISEFVKYGEDNYLSVVVSAIENDVIPPFGGEINFLGYGGIYREVSLVIHEEFYLKESYLRLLDLNKKKIAFQFITSKDIGEVKLMFYNNEELRLEKIFDVKERVNNYSFDFQNVDLWDLDNPNLYDVVIEYYIDEKLVDSLSYKTGFRKVEFKKDGFFLNDKKIKLHGITRHQSYPYVGYAMPKSVQEQDAKIIKYELGFNLVRATHYLQSKHFLNYCDEIGLLVIKEIPGSSFMGSTEFQNNLIRNLKSMINFNYHHPSIVLWGVRMNNSLDDELYIQTNKIAKELDSSRATGGFRSIKRSNLYEDVFTYNDYYYKDKKNPFSDFKNDFKNVPFIITHHIGEIYPVKVYDTENRLIEHTLLHENIFEKFKSNKTLNGLVVDTMCDYNTNFGYGSGDYISYHGLLDMFRLPKFAASIYKAQVSKEPFIDILSSLSEGDYNQNNLDSIYIATNVEYIRLYRDGKFINSFYPKRKSNLNYPLIIIDDFVGDLIMTEEKIKRRSARFFKRIIPKLLKEHYNLSFRDRYLLNYHLSKNNLSLNKLQNLVLKYSRYNSTFRFDGIMRGVVAVSKTISPLDKVSYLIEVDNNELIHGITYDATRVVVKKVDQNNNILRYGNDPLKISVSNSLELLGKEDLSLIGGSVAFWVRSKKANSLGEIKVKIDNKEIVKNIKIN